MLELVVFDVDGLMLDTESVWKIAFDKAGDKYGIKDMGSTLFPKLIGKSGRDEKEVLDRYLSSDIQSSILPTVLYMIISRLTLPSESAKSSSMFLTDFSISDFTVGESSEMFISE